MQLQIVFIVVVILSPRWKFQFGFLIAEFSSGKCFNGWGHFYADFGTIRKL